MGEGGVMGKERPFVCVDCGEEHTSGKRGPLSIRCKRCQAIREGPGLPRERTCEVCGRPFAESGKSGPAPKCCSGECERARMRARFRATRRSARHTCKWCGKEWVGFKRRFCTPECRAMAYARAHGAVPPAEAYERKKKRTLTEKGRACERCGTVFLFHRGGSGSGGAGRFCSRSCYHEAQRDGTLGTVAAEGSGGNAKRRAELAGVEYEHIDRIKVFKRDKWRCQICGCKTPKKYKAGALNAPTLDHVVPIIKGGPHIYANVRCACRSCNSRKHDHTETGQTFLRLVVAQ